MPREKRSPPTGGIGFRRRVAPLRAYRSTWGLDVSPPVKGEEFPGETFGVG